MDDRPPGTDDAPPGTGKPARASAIDFFDAAPAPSAPAPADQAAPTIPPPPPPPPDEPKLPPGWTAHPDQKTGATYYWHAATGATSWDVPETSRDVHGMSSGRPWMSRGCPGTSWNIHFLSPEHEIWSSRIH